MPLDVLKTRMMNAPPHTYNSLFHCLKDLVQVGPLALFKGFTPAFIRLGERAMLFFVGWWSCSFVFCFRSAHDLDVHLSWATEKVFWFGEEQRSLTRCLLFVLLLVFLLTMNKRTMLFFSVGFAWAEERRRWNIDERGDVLVGGVSTLVRECRLCLIEQWRRLS